MNAHHHHRPHPEDSSRRPSFLLELWAAADQCVPFPFLLLWRARPAPNCAAATLRHLTRVDFVYGTTTDFIVLIGCLNGAFTPAIVERGPRKSGEFQLMPMMGRQEVRLTPEQAEEHIETYLLRQDLQFWEQVFIETGLGLDEVVKLEVKILCHHYRQLPWHSVRLERPRHSAPQELSWPPRPNMTEPIYKFKKEKCCCEIWVGAQSGNVDHRYIQEGITPPPPINPPSA